MTYNGTTYYYVTNIQGDVIAISRIKMVGENGRTYFAKLEIYGQKFIRDDLGGHLFKDGATISRHFNAGIIDEVGKFIQNELHFWY